MDDVKLISLLKEGSPLAFRRLYDQYWERLFVSAYKFLRKEALAKDVVQEVFVDMWNRRETIDPQNLPSYLHTATKFQCFKQLRRSEMADVDNIDLPDHLIVNNTEESIHVKELEAQIKESLEGLPQNRKDIFQLSRFEQLSNKEIADQLNIPIRTVEWHLYEALKYLKIKLKEQRIA